MSKESIVRVAIDFREITLSLPPPKRHHDVIRLYHEQTGRSSSGRQQGFITSEGRFVGRAEAAKIAFAAGQIAEPKRVLYSEDLW